MHGFIVRLSRKRISAGLKPNFSASNFHSSPPKSKKARTTQLITRKLKIRVLSIWPKLPELSKRRQMEPVGMTAENVGRVFQNQANLTQWSQHRSSPMSFTSGLYWRQLVLGIFPLQDMNGQKPWQDIVLAVCMFHVCIFIQGPK